MNDDLKMVDHRPFSLNRLPWVMTQTWEDVLFLHWPVDEQLLRKHIPETLELDVYEGKAWLGIVPFEVKGMRPRLLPTFPFIGSFLELNVRTYVKYKGKPGVYFFSLDTSNFVVVTMAKIGYALPYRHAEMKIERKHQEIILSNNWKDEKQSEHFQCTYTPVSPIYYSEKGTLDHWLTERYCLWTVRGNMLMRTDIHHTKWELQNAEVALHHNTMASFLPTSIYDKVPVAHYCQSKQAYFWPPIIENN